MPAFRTNFGYSISFDALRMGLRLGQGLDNYLTIKAAELVTARTAPGTRVVVTDQDLLEAAVKYLPESLLVELGVQVNGQEGERRSIPA